MNLKSLIIIVLLVLFYTTQASATQTCQQTFSKDIIQTEVVSGTPPKNPLPVKTSLSENQRRFREAYNKGEFKGDERYVSKFIPFIQTVEYQNYRITGLENGDLIVDRIDRKGSIKSSRIQHNTDSAHPPLKYLSIDKQSKEMFHRVEQSKPLSEVHFDSKNKEELNRDKIDRLIFIGKQLRNFPGINPYKTHIADFADYITSHVEFIRQGILSSGKDIDSKIKILDTFKHEAETKRDNKELTYQYWLFWNMRLSILVSSIPPSWDWKTWEGTLSHKNRVKLDSDKLNTFSRHSVKAFLEQFPRFVILPVIGPLGYKDFNKAFPHGVFPIELQNKDTIQDSELMSPHYSYDHDMNHHSLSIYRRSDVQMGEHPWGKRYLSVTETLPDKIREMAEIAFFIFFHEVGTMIGSKVSRENFFENNVNDSRQELIHHRLRNRKNDLGMILPKDIQSEKEIEKYFKQAIDVFNRIHLEILESGVTP